MKMFPVLLELKPEGNHWLARCKALDVMTQGETPEHAIHNLNEALVLFTESCLRRGTLDQVLRESGIPQAELEAFYDHTRQIMPDAWETARGCHA